MLRPIHFPNIIYHNDQQINYNRSENSVFMAYSIAMCYALFKMIRIPDTLICHVR